jgi:hypothetical protein
MSTAAVVDAQYELMARAAEVQSAEYDLDDVRVERAYQRLALAARELTRATNNLRLDEQPVGWREQAWPVRDE